MLVRFFGAAKAIAGAESVEVPDGAKDVAEFVVLLSNACGPELAAMLPYCRFAVGANVLDAASRFPSSGEVVVLPPVSGGMR